MTHFSLAELRELLANTEPGSLFLEDMNLRDMDLTELGSLQDAAFDRCCLENVNLSKVNLSNVHFKDCNLVGSKFNGAALVAVTFAGCNLAFSAWEGAMGEGVAFDAACFFRDTTGTPEGFTLTLEPRPDTLPSEVEGGAS